MIPTYAFFLLLVCVALLYFGYQFQNPYLIIFASIIPLLFGLLAYAGVMTFNDASTNCDLVPNATMTNGSMTSLEYAPYCWEDTNSKMPFANTAIGTFFVLLSLYFIYQGILNLKE